jgi:hypothetical protein
LLAQTPRAGRRAVAEIFVLAVRIVVAIGLDTGLLRFDADVVSGARVEVRIELAQARPSAGLNAVAVHAIVAVDVLGTFDGQAHCLVLQLDTGLALNAGWWRILLACAVQARLESITFDVVAAFGIELARAVRDLRTRLAQAVDASLLTIAVPTVVAVGVVFAVEGRALLEFFVAEFLERVAGYVRMPTQARDANFHAVTEPSVVDAVSVDFALGVDAPVLTFETGFRRPERRDARSFRGGLANAIRIT